MSRRHPPPPPRWPGTRKAELCRTCGPPLCSRQVCRRPPQWARSGADKETVTPVFMKDPRQLLCPVTLSDQSPSDPRAEEQMLICRLIAYGAKPAGSGPPRPLPQEGASRRGGGPLCSTPSPLKRTVGALLLGSGRNQAQGGGVTGPPAQRAPTFWHRGPVLWQTGLSTDGRKVGVVSG